MTLRRLRQWLDRSAVWPHSNGSGIDRRVVGELKDVRHRIAVGTHDGSINRAGIGIFSFQERRGVLNADVVAIDRVRRLDVPRGNESAQWPVPSPLLAELVPQGLPELVDLVGRPCRDVGTSRAPFPTFLRNSDARRPRRGEVDARLTKGCCRSSLVSLPPETGRRIGDSGDEPPRDQLSEFVTALIRSGEQMAGSPRHGGGALRRRPRRGCRRTL